MIRRLFTVAAALSLVLCVFAAVCWLQVRNSYDLAIRDWQTGQMRMATAGEEIAFKQAPLWAAVLFAVLPAAWMGMVIRRAIGLYEQEGRRQQGLCPKCGYDLRASKHRCPECGVVFGSERCR